MGKTFQTQAISENQPLENVRDGSGLVFVRNLVCEPSNFGDCFID